MPNTYENMVDLDHLSLYHDKAKQLFATKADHGALSARVDDLEAASGEPNAIEGVTVGGVAVTPDADKVVALGTAASAATESTLTDGRNLPTGAAVKAFVEGKGYQTASDVATAVAGAGHLRKEVAPSVPTAAEADADTLYYVMNATSGHYDIWQLVGGSVVRLDDVSVDLSGYVRSDDVTVVTNAQINGLFS